MAEQMGLEGDNLTLEENRFARAGYLFLGWAESANGAVAFADGAMISGIDAAADGAILYAVWKPCAPNLIPSENVTFMNASQAVSISCAVADVTILYTTDGSNPAVNGNVYREPFLVYESCTVRAIARKVGLMDSDEMSITLARADGLTDTAWHSPTKAAEGDGRDAIGGSERL